MYAVCQEKNKICGLIIDHRALCAKKFNLNYYGQ